MIGSSAKKLSRLLLPFGSLVLCASLMAAPVPRFGAAPQAPPDNTKKNKEQPNPNADQQRMNAADTALAQKIRKSITDDKTLSTYAHNIKIIAQDGKVTLRGPVRTEDEKASINQKAIALAGDGNVNNLLEVAPPKQ